jgi:hypothetical protein
MNVLDTGPSWPIDEIENDAKKEAETRGDAAFAWNHNLPQIKDLAGLLRYLAASKVTPQQFVEEYNLYKKNVDKVSWLKELEKLVK